MHALEKEMATHSSVLAWRIQGRRSLVGCHLWGLTELDTAEAMQQQQQQQQQQAPWRSENTLALKLLYNTVSKKYISCVHTSCIWKSPKYRGQHSKENWWHSLVSEWVILSKSWDSGVYWLWFKFKIFLTSKILLTVWGWCEVYRR